MRNVASFSLVFSKQLNYVFTAAKFLQLLLTHCILELYVLKTAENQDHDMAEESTSSRLVRNACNFHCVIFSNMIVVPKLQVWTTK